MTTRLRTLYIKVTIVHRQKEHVHAPSQSCIDISKFYPYVSGLVSVNYKKPAASLDLKNYTAYTFNYQALLLQRYIFLTKPSWRIIPISACMYIRQV